MSLGVIQDLGPRPHLQETQLWVMVAGRAGGLTRGAFLLPAAPSVTRDGMWGRAVQQAHLTWVEMMYLTPPGMGSRARAVFNSSERGTGATCSPFRNLGDGKV